MKLLRKMALFAYRLFGYTRVQYRAMGTVRQAGGPMPAFETELKTFAKNLQSLLMHDGKFVVIRGEEILGTYDTYADALGAGYAKYGAATPFLVQKIAPAQTVAFSTRAIVSCPA